MTGSTPRACRPVPAWLEERRDGALGPGRSLRLDAHLAACAGCRRLAGETAPLNLFAGLLERGVPDHVEDFILGGLHAEEAHARHPWLAACRSAMVRWEALPVLATLLLVAVLVIAWASGGTGPTQALPDESDVWLRAHSMTDTVRTVEEIRSPTAEILAFSLESESGPTEVILIVDRSIDL